MRSSFRKAWRSSPFPRLPATGRSARSVKATHPCRGISGRARSSRRSAFTTTALMIDAVRGEMNIRNVAVSFARYCATIPEVLFGNDALQARETLAALPDALAEAMKAPASPVADGLRAMFSTLNEDEAPQEGGPTFAEIRELERQNALLGPLALLIKAEAVLAVIAGPATFLRFEAMPIGPASSAEASALRSPSSPLCRRPKQTRFFAEADRLARAGPGRRGRPEATNTAKRASS